MEPIKNFYDMTRIEKDSCMTLKTFNVEVNKKLSFDLSKKIRLHKQNLPIIADLLYEYGKTQYNIGFRHGFKNAKIDQEKFLTSLAGLVNGSINQIDS